MDQKELNKILAKQCVDKDVDVVFSYNPGTRLVKPEDKHRSGYEHVDVAALKDGDIVHIYDRKYNGGVEGRSGHSISLNGTKIQISEAYEFGQDFLVFGYEIFNGEKSELMAWSSIDFQREYSEEMYHRHPFSNETKEILASALVNVNKPIYFFDPLPMLDYTQFGAYWAFGGIEQDDKITFSMVVSEYTGNPNGLKLEPTEKTFEQLRLIDAARDDKVMVINTQEAVFLSVDCAEALYKAQQHKRALEQASHKFAEMMVDMGYDLSPHHISDVGIKVTDATTGNKIQPKDIRPGMSIEIEYQDLGYMFSTDKKIPTKTHTDDYKLQVDEIYYDTNSEQFILTGQRTDRDDSYTILLSTVDISDLAHQIKQERYEAAKSIERRMSEMSVYDKAVSLLIKNPTISFDGNEISSNEWQQLEPGASITLSGTQFAEASNSANFNINISADVTIDKILFVDSTDIAFTTSDGLLFSTIDFREDRAIVAAELVQQEKHQDFIEEESRDIVMDENFDWEDPRADRDE